MAVLSGVCTFTVQQGEFPVADIIGFMMSPTTKYSILRDIFRGINLQKRAPGRRLCQFQEGDDYEGKKRSFSRWRFEKEFSDNSPMLSKPHDR